MYRQSKLRAVIKWKYHVLLTRIQIENHFNLLTSVCINAWENTAYVTNPLTDCTKKSEYVSAFVFDSPLIHIKTSFHSIKTDNLETVERKTIKKYIYFEQSGLNLLNHEPTLNPLDHNLSG